MEKSDVPYAPLDADASPPRGRVSDPIRIVEVGGYTKSLWYMKLIGGYIANITVIPILIIIYHVLNVAFAAWTLSPNILLNEEHKFCIEFELTILAIQINAFILYLIAFYSLNHKDPIAINNTLERRFKNPSWILMIIIMIPFTICIVSALCSWIQWKVHYRVTRYYLQLVLYIFGHKPL